MDNSFRQTVAGIFADARMHKDLVLRSHTLATPGRAKATGGEYLIACQDTTFYSYPGHTRMEGVGKLQGRRCFRSRQSGLVAPADEYAS